MHVKNIIAAMALGALAACGAPSRTSPIPVMQGNAPAPQVVHAFATQTLNALQSQSIRNSREYCGYILLINGRLSATRPIAGGEAFCEMAEPGPSVIASYHTHGSFSDVYDNEVPSTDDLRSDFAFNTDGYVSTPGGRIWHIDHETRRAYLLCGARCVISDPADNPSAAPPVQSSYALSDLLQREG